MGSAVAEVEKLLHQIDEEPAQVALIEGKQETPRFCTKKTSPPWPKMTVIARCTPTLGMVSVFWHTAVESLAWPMNVIKAPLTLIDDKPNHLRTGNEIAEARNYIVSKALSFENDEREVSHLFWIDDDVIITANALECLLSHDRDIASGVYFLKAEFPSPLIFPSRGGGTAKFTPNKLVEAWGCGMGLTLVKTSVYSRMRDELDLGKDANGNPEWYKARSKAQDGEIKDGVMFCGGSEDLYFCEQAGKLGINPLIDCGKWAFGFHWCSKQRIGYPQEQWSQRQASKPVVWPDGTVWE